MTQIPTPNPGYNINDLAELISRRMRDVSANINSCLIGTIVSFNATNQTAVVSVNFQKVIKGIVPLASGLVGDQIIPYPQLVNVPVVFLQGGGASLTFPIAAGDTCLILFCDRDMDNWFENGTIAQPNSDRVHNINDAICLVGIRALTNSLTNYNANIVTLADQTGSRISVTGDIKASYQTQSHSGWLLMDGVSTIGPSGSGATYAGAQYQFLFTLLGGNWSGGGAVTLPNGQGNTLAGYKSGDPNFGTLGKILGEAAHTLVVNEIPPLAVPLGADFSNYGSQALFLSRGEDNVMNFATTGGNGSHNNIQPTLIINWFIKI